jgi:hypothetical protein
MTSSPGPQVSFTNKTDRHDIAEILLKVMLNTITLYPLNYMAVDMGHNPVLALKVATLAMGK